jgi:hypothetical protein
MGSKERIWAVVPGGRVQLENNRFIEVYGPIVDINLGFRTACGWVFS